MLEKAPLFIGNKKVRERPRPLLSGLIREKISDGSGGWI
jgi:hypothetical protein